MSTPRFDELHRFSATFDDLRVPREYLLVVASGRIAVVRTKVLELSSLSINWSNRLARFGYQIGYKPFVFADPLLHQHIFWHAWWDKSDQYVQS
jgi:hypothetical protein